MATHAAESDRLWLQPLSIGEHLQDCHSIQSNPRAMEWSTKDTFTDIQQTIDMMQDSLPTAEKPWNQRWAILLRQLPGSQENSDKPRMIGIIGIVREQEIGYKVHPDFWGKGYMTEALKMFINLYWKMEVNTKYDKLIAAADPGNPASLRILEKAGFQKGEYKKDFYERVVDGLVIKGDLQFFYLPRPHF